MTSQPIVPLQIEHLPIESLRPDAANPRRISDAELEALTRSIGEFGFLDPVIARREDRTVIGGHQRLLAARRLGMKTVPVVLVDLTLEQSRLLNVALNKISGSWDDELLARLLADLKPIDGIDLTLTGFEEDELDKLLRSLEQREKRERVEQFDLDAALEQATHEPRTQAGDMWLLGPHRLACGDATKAEDVGRLLAGERAQLAFTDPPYNVALGDHGGQQRGARKRRIQNDALPPEQWDEFCRGWSRNLVENVDGAFYICMSTKEWPLVSRVLEEAGAHWSDTIIWAKDRFVLGRADYQRQYEPIWFGWREGVKHFWCGEMSSWRGPNSAKGWDSFSQWLESLGDERRVGIEGAWSYGRQLAQTLVARGEHVHEVNTRWTARAVCARVGPIRATGWMPARWPRSSIERVTRSPRSPRRIRPRSLTCSR